MSFLLILTVIVCIVNSQPLQCLSSQTELFYENAENLNDWIFDNDGTAQTGYNPYIGDTYCGDEACYSIYQLDSDSVTTTPNFLSNLGLISTIGFTDITINYALQHAAFSFMGGPGGSGYSSSTANGECGSSYTVDGETFPTLDSHVSVAGMTIGEWATSPMLIITESLGADATNTATLQIRWETTSLWPINSTNSYNFHHCLIDEIRLCGTAITTSTTATPTTVTPTTTTPTTYHSDSGSDDSGSGSGDSSDSASKRKLKLKRKKKSRFTSSESSESIYSALSSMNGVDDHEKNVNGQNVNFVISVSPKTSINLVIIFVLFLFGCTCFFTFLCIYQYKAPPAAFNNIV